MSFSIQAEAATFCQTARGPSQDPLSWAQPRDLGAGPCLPASFLCDLLQQPLSLFELGPKVGSRSSPIKTASTSQPWEHARRGSPSPAGPGSPQMGRVAAKGGSLCRAYTPESTYTWFTHMRCSPTDQVSRS